MNSLTLFLIVVGWFAIGYFVYSKFLERRLIKINDKNKTPAYKNKGVDYKASKKEFLFGHHFASIAGAGPIIGPILAVSYFGWLFVVLWIAIGTFFIGAVHDYLSLMISVRNNGKGIAKTSEKIIGRKTFFIFSILLWFTLMLIITVFSVSAAQSFVEVPTLIIPFFGLTITAIFLGIGVYKLKLNKFILSLIALILAVFFIYLGVLFPITLPFPNSTSQIVWIIVLFVYAFIVSLIPVWILLQPRDYITSLVLFLFLGIGILSVVIANPVIEAPARIYSNIPIWPILFITVACGAVSGFHALVSSGTTSKQLDKESNGRFIGYGAMLLEGVLALLVVIFISAGLKWNNLVAGDLNFFQNALSSGWIVAFGNGFANIVNSAFPFFKISVLVTLGALVINLFILTSLDTSTRIGRMITSEMLKSKSKLNNRILLTLIILIPAFFLAITNSYVTLWRLFGSSNQLIASVILLIISAYLIERKKPSAYTLIPGLFMIITTLYALFYQIFNKTGYLAEKNIILIGISLVLIIFALIIFIGSLMNIIKRKCLT